MANANTVVFERMGTSVRQERAQRADGQWFERTQYMGPRGYCWTAWHAVNVHFPEDWRANPYAGRVRLPKVAA
jgi:hypothetical protein